MPLSDWVEVKQVRHLVKHTITAAICLLLATPIKLLADLVSHWSRFPPLIEQALEWVEYAYLFLVLAIFAASTIKSIWKGMFDE